MNIFLVLAFLLLIVPARADMYQDASNAVLPVARTNLGLGTMATQNASAVAITGGVITGIPGLVVGPPSSTDFSVPVYNNNKGTLLADPDLVILNSARTDGHGGGLDGNAVILMQPAMGVISTVDHASGLFVMPSITGCPTPAACSNNTAVTAQWGDGLSGTTGYVPAGTGGVLGGFNVNLYSNQTVADLGSFGNNGAFGATIHTTNGTPIDGLDVDFEPGGSVPNGTMVGVSIHFNNSTPASAYPLIGFNADATGSAGGTTAFQVTGSWKNSIVADAPATFAVGGSVANQTSAVLAHTQTAGIRALGAQAVLGSEVVDVVTIGGFAGGGYRLLNVEDSNGGNLGSGTIRFEVDAGGSIKAPYLATASTGGGFAVCVDNAGILYRRAACP